MGAQVNLGNMPSALQAYLGNVKKLSKNLGVPLNTAPIQLPPALSQGFTTQLGGRPSSFNEAILSAAKTGQTPSTSGLPVGTQDNTQYDPNAFIKAMQAQTHDAELNAMGKDSAPHHESLLQKAFNVLSAPEHGLVGGIEDLGLNLDKGSINPIHFLQGAKEGLTGHGAFANQDYGDYFNLLSNRNGVADKADRDSGEALRNDLQQTNRIGGGWQHILGTAGDVVLDPLNLVGVGEVAKLGEGARGLEELANARRAIGIKAAGKTLPLVPLLKKAEIISGIGKLPGEGTSNLAHGLANFKQLGLKVNPSRNNIEASLSHITDEPTREALVDSTIKNTLETKGLQAQHPYLTKIASGFNAPSRLLGDTFGKGPQGLLGARGRQTVLDNETRAGLLRDFKGISPSDNHMLLEHLKSGGYGPLAKGDVVARTNMHENVAPVFTQHLEESRHLIHDYFSHGGTADHLNEQLKYLGSKDVLTPEIVNNDTLWQAWLSTLHGPDDASHLAYSLRNAADHARNNRDLADMIKSNHGYDLRNHVATTGEGKGKINKIGPKGQAKIDAGYVPVDHPLFKDENGNATHIFHPDQAPLIENLFKLLHDPLGKSRTTNPFIKLFDRSQNTYKRAVTVYNPGSHSRYLMSSVIQNHINGLRNPYNYIKAARIALHNDPEAKYRQVLGHIDPDILRMPDYAKASQGKGFVVNHSQRLGRKMTDQEIIHDMSRYGLAHNFTHANLSPEGLGSGTKMNRLNEALLKFGDSRDSIPRMAMYMDALERAPKGLAEEDAKRWAADQTIKSLHNFSDLTQFERDWMQRMVPFYADIRKNMPMVMKAIVTHPGRVAAYPLGLQEAEEGTGGLKEENNPLFKYLTPDYLMSSGAVPVGHHGDNPVFLNQKNHLSDLFYQLGGQPLSGGIPKEAGQEANFLGRQFGLSTLTPFLRVPAEIGAKRQFYSGNPINSPLRYATQQLPLSNAIQKIFENRAKGGNGGGVDPGNPVLTPALINYITGLGLSENSPVQQQAAANSKAIPSKKEIQRLLPTARVP